MYSYLRTGNSLSILRVKVNNCIPDRGKTERYYTSNLRVAPSVFVAKIIELFN